MLHGAGRTKAEHGANPPHNYRRVYPFSQSPVNPKLCPLKDMPAERHLPCLRGGPHVPEKGLSQGYGSRYSRSARPRGVNAARHLERRSHIIINTLLDKWFDDYGVDGTAAPYAVPSHLMKWPCCGLGGAVTLPAPAPGSTGVPPALTCEPTASLASPTCVSEVTGTLDVC